MNEIVLTPAAESDLPFLRQLFATSRPEAALLPDPLVDLQFRAQRLAYREQFPHADERIVWADGRPCGRLLVDRSPQRIHLVDVALLPDQRGKGIGTRLLQALQQEAQAAVLPLRLQVFQDNPARRLYARLGFSEIDSRRPYLTMEWRPATGGTPCST